MSERKHFRITTGPTIRHDTVIEMDGEPLTNICEYSVSAKAGVATTITLTFINVDVNLDIPEAVEVSDKDSVTKEYVRTAPARDGSADESA